MRFELHCHSTCSDGTDAPAAVAARAVERDAAVFALTDHDTCAGTAEAIAPGLRAIRAVEISCDDRGRTIHVLAYERGGGDWSALEQKIAAVREARVNRVRVMAARLEHRGIRLDVDALIAAAVSRSIGRPDLARAMVAAGHATSLKDAFARHLFDHGPVDVPHKALPLVDALAAARDANAALSLAHPHLYEDRAAALIRAHKAAGLTGIEAYYGAYDARERARWTRVADELGATCTGGSDWHGAAEARCQPGVDLPADRSDMLLAWLG